MGFLMFDSFIIIGCAIDLVFHVSEPKNQDYFFNLKFLLITLYMNLKASCALDLGLKSFVVIKGVHEAKCPLATQVEIL